MPIGSLTLPVELRRIQLRSRKLVTGDLLGQYRSAFRGSGLIFSDLREYQPGDDIKHIHWKATARTGTVFVKSFEEERQLRVMLAVDTSQSMRASWGEQSFSRAVEFCSLIGALTQRGNDMLGLTTFADTVTASLPPKAGPKLYSRILSTLLQESTRSSQTTDLARALEHLMSTLRRTSIIFILSDFECDVPKDLIARLCTRHDVVLVQFQPPESRLISAGIVSFRDAETGQLCSVDTSSKRVQRAWAEALAKRRANLKAIAKECGADHIIVSDSPAMPLMNLMRERVRRVAR
jgi:uncharacterized protein (DUF58 family)